MAQYATYSQIAGEIKTYTVDFTDSLPSGGSVTAGTVTHTPPIGGATLSPATSVTTPYVYVTFTAPTVTGVHYLDVFGTFSDSDKQGVRLEIDVVYPAGVCRAGMQTLVDTVRGMTDTNPNDYTIAGVRYWTDAQLQTVLDRHKVEFYRESAVSVDTYENSNAAVRKIYWLPYQNLETGTAFELETDTGTTAGTASYTLDAQAGKITFSTDQGGIAYVASGAAYDINLAAADIWRVKAANASKLYSFATDNHRIDRGSYFKNCIEMAKYYEAAAGPQTIDLDRSDYATG
jgi:hypothetical protein